MSRKKLVSYSVVILIGLFLVGASLSQENHARERQTPVLLEAAVSPDFPADIYEDGTTAYESSLRDASIFAWREFIALNWPALDGTRDTHDPDALFGEPDRSVVWQTHRSKVELFPGRGNPPGYEEGPPDYGYYQMPPQYNYRDPIDACDPAQQNNVPPLINLDELGQIFQDTLHAGVYSDGMGTDNQVLYTAKGNHVQYAYLMANQIYTNGNNPAHESSPNYGLWSSTWDYVRQNNESPPANSDTAATGLFSFPSGVVENKAGWRRLTEGEVASGRFFMSVVRYYDHDEDYDGRICFRDSNLEDDVWGLVALHIVHKTPTAPYFTFATFSQADNILDPDGNPVEDENGNVYPQYRDLPPLEPNIQSTFAHIDAGGNFVRQTFDPMTANCAVDDSRLRFINTLEVTVVSDDGSQQAIPFATTQGVTCINSRIHPIPDDVIAVNTAFHNAIDTYNELNGLQDSPWLYYKLINIQYAPINKPAGLLYLDGDGATYYLTNTVVESNYNLQLFSGTSQFDYPLNGPFLGLATDYAPLGRGDNPPVFNVRFQGKEYNMGGCMGCHGLVQGGNPDAGQDFSFMTQGGPVCTPEVAGDPEVFAICNPAP